MSRGGMSTTMLWRGHGAGLGNSRKAQRCVSPQDSLPTRPLTATRLRIAMQPLQPPSSAGLQFACNTTPGRHHHQQRRHHHNKHHILCCRRLGITREERASTATAQRNGFPPPASGFQGLCRFTCVSRLPSANSELSLASNKESQKRLLTSASQHRLRRRKAGPVCSRRAACPSIFTAPSLFLIDSLSFYTTSYSLLKSASSACSISPMTYHINHVSPSVSPLLLVTLQPAPSPSDARIPVLKRRKIAEYGQPQRP